VLTCTVLALGAFVSVRWMRTRRAPESAVPIAEADGGEADGSSEVAQAALEPMGDVPSSEITSESRATAASSGRIRGELIDKRWQEPIPDFTLEFVRDGATLDRCATDASGRFESPQVHASGPIMVRYLDWPTRQRPQIRPESLREETIAWDAERELRLETEVGPTFVIQLDPNPPDERSSFRVRLSEQLGPGGRGSLRGGIIDTPAGYRPRALLAATILRDGDWARFPFVPELYDDPIGSWYFSVESNDVTGWSGVAELESVSLHNPNYVRVAMEARGTIAVAAHGVESIPQLPLTISVEAVSASGTALPVSFTVTDDAPRGASGLSPGEYRIRSRSIYMEPVDQLVQLAPHEHKRVDLAIAALPSAGAIRGTARNHDRSQTPIMFSSVRQVVIARADDPTLREAREFSWRKSGHEWIASFSFEAVPAGKYVVRIRDFPLLDDGVRFDPAQFEVSPPAEDLEFVMRPRPESMLNMAVSPRDSATDEPITDASLAWRLPGDADRTEHIDRHDNRIYFRIPTDTPIEWTLSARGHAPARGDLSAFEGNEYGRTATIRLRKGWGTRFVVRAQTTDTPIADARIVLDGVDAGRTDSKGELDVELAAEPERADIDASGWAFDGGDVDANGAIVRSFPRCEVRMRPAN
jgi:hypothetical protein